MQVVVISHRSMLSQSLVNYIHITTMNVEHLVEVGSRAVYDKFTDTIPKYKLQVAFMAMIEAIKAASLTESVSMFPFN